jgi:hypothetical protein
MARRKVIQIVHSGRHLYALCGDGSMWARNENGGWLRIESIPQEDE